MNYINYISFLFITFSIHLRLRHIFNLFYYSFATTSLNLILLHFYYIFVTYANMHPFTTFFTSLCHISISFYYSFARKMLIQRFYRYFAHTFVTQYKILINWLNVCESYKHRHNEVTPRITTPRTTTQSSFVLKVVL